MLENMIRDEFLERLAVFYVMNQPDQAHKCDKSLDGQLAILIFVYIFDGGN